MTSIRRSWLLGLAVAALSVSYLVPVSFAAPASKSVAPRGSAPTITAKQFAARYQMDVTDAGTTVTLRGPLVTVRIYPGTNRVSVLGDAHRLKDAIERREGSVRIPARPVSFLGQEIIAKRREIFARRDAFHVPVVQVPPAPKPRARPRVRIRPVAKPRPARKARPREPAPDPSWTPRASERHWKWIVVHHSDDRNGNAAKYDRIHREKNGWDSLGYHFVIGNGSLSGDGEVEVGPRWPIQKHGAHARNHDLGDNRYNEQGIGICLVGDFDTDGRRPSTRQLAALTRLVRWLMKRYDIPANMVLRHCDCCSTQCPGRYFPWEAFEGRLR